MLVGGGSAECVGGGPLNEKRLPGHGEGELIGSGLSDTKPDGVIYITNLVVGLAWPNFPGDKIWRLRRCIQSGIIPNVAGSDGRDLPWRFARR